MSHGLEDVFRLSPLQEGMLFESLYAAGRDAYVVQVSWTLEGDLDPAALRRAWEAAVRRHGVLRTSFHWREMEHPHQVVHRQVELPWVEEDWRGLPPDERGRRLEERLEAERRGGFDLETAPLFRLLLLRLEERRWTLVWTQHHLLLDGWSVTRVLQELFASYSALRRGAEPSLPPAIPFRRYIDWLRRRDPAEAEAFWRGELAGFTAPTPVGGGVAPRHAFRGHGRLDAALDEAATAALAELARRSRLTLNTCVQGAWALLLARRSGEDDVVFGAVVSGRSAADLPGVETAVGPFLNTVPLRARPAPDAPLLPWLAALQERQLEARRFENSPLVEIQGWSGVPRDRPLFESLLAFEGSLYDPALGEGAEGVRVVDARSNRVSRAPLTLVAVPEGGRLHLSLTWDRGRFEAADARRRLEQLLTVLRGMAEKPDRTLGEIPLLPPAERQAVAVEWPSSPGLLPGSPGLPGGAGLTLHGLFLEQARRRPEATALVSGEERDERVSYGELARRAAEVARRLRAAGVGPEVPVAVSLPRSPALVEAVLGILMAGGAYVPLDPDDPPERRERVVADSGARLVLDGRDEGDPEEGSFHPAEGDDAALAYILYTSGTTGRPKGVAVPHAAAVNNLLWAQSVYGLRPEEAGLFKTAPGFDVAVRELFWPLSVGARVVIARPGGERDPGYLLDLIRREAAPVASFVPSLLAAVLDRADQEGLPAALRTVISGAETLPPELADRLLEHHPGVALVNHYGPTETAVNATFRRCRPGERPVPIGRPIAGVRAEVLDAWGDPAPAGVAGEIVLGGAAVGRGYLGRPGLTAERFVPDPFPEAPGARRYRTGDLGRWRADGVLEHLGRIDLQVKVRGYRVEPGEVEAALAACPGVREAAVVARGGALAAFVATAGAAGAAGGGVPADLRDALAARLPAWMIPSAWVFLDELPRTPSGKVDRRALAERGLGEIPAAGFEPPRTPLEEQVAEVWAGVLGRERIGAHDDVFALGAHSLLALQAAARLREATGVELPLRALFEAPTPAALAREVEAALRAGTGPSSPPPPPLVPVPRDGDLPLSFSQESLWLLHQLDPASPAYNVPAAVIAEGRLDAAALARTLEEIARRHEALRTSFPVAGGRPVQRIHPPAPVPLPRVDVAGLPAELRAPEARRLARQEALLPFDLARGPLLRAALVRLAPEEHLVLLTLHHAVSDEWSVAVLVRELAAIYPAFAEGRPSPLPGLPVQVADHAVWQRRWLQGEALEARLAWWRERLAGAPAVTELPLDRPRNAGRGSRGGRAPLALPPETAAALRRLGRERAASLFMVLLAGVQAWLVRLAGAAAEPEAGVVIGAPVANRSHPATEGLIGFFVNTLPLRGELGGDPEFAELVERARETALGAFAHQDLPFERLVQELRPERSLAHAPLFQVMLALHNVPVPALELPGLSLRPLEIDPGTAKMDLVLELMEEEGGVRGALEYAADLFDRATAERLAGHLRTLLAAAVEDPGRPFSALPLLAPEERRQAILRGAASSSFPGFCLHRLFEARAAERPEAVAVTGDGGGGEALTYGELERRANRLARRLRRLGVGPEARVGLIHGRTPGLLVGLLGILKAGGAYVPVDPAWPEERRRLVLEDAGVAVQVDEGVVAGVAAAGEDDEDTPLDARAVPENLAYVIYTSGSTGRPKGALVTHANASRLLAAAGAAGLGGGPEDVWTLFHSAAFDFSVWEIWGALAGGGRLVVVPGDTARSPEAFHALLERERVTVLNQTPSAFRALSRLPPPPTLRLVIFGGEALEVSLAAGWRERGVRQVNMYGITETTVHVTHRELTSEDVAAPWQSPVGEPLPGYSLHLLDRRGEPVPLGIAGEICVGGLGAAGVCRGYLGRPDLTAERFVPDPFAGEPGARLYRSGDLARRLSRGVDGGLAFLGRIDQQVKLRGFRIEPGEIEAALAALPGVAQAAVVLREDLPAGPALAAYVVAGEGGEPTTGDLLAGLRRRLPEHLVPGHFVFLTALPLTPTGKLDRRALPAPEGARPELARAYTAPRTALERVVAGAWEEALGVERVGVEDSFFDLGGHSLLATQVISWVRETFEVEVPLRGLFDRPTVAALAEALAAHPGAERTAELLLEVAEMSEEEVAQSRGGGGEGG